MIDLTVLIVNKINELAASKGKNCVITFCNENYETTIVVGDIKYKLFVYEPFALLNAYGFLSEHLAVEEYKEKIKGVLNENVIS